MARSRFSIPLHYQIIIMLFAGGFFGYYLTEATSYKNWMGDLFLRALNMIIVPLILLSITTGVASVGSSGNLGRLGLKTIGFYILSTLAAILTGFILVRAIEPGTGADLGFKAPVQGIAAASDSFGQTLIKIIPQNIFEALAQGQMLSIIFFSILFGFFMTKIGEKPRDKLSDIFNAALDVIMKITLFIIKFTPLGIFSITAKVIAQQVEIGSYDTPGEAQSLTIAGEYVYVADGSDGMHVINIADPAHPVLAGSLDTSGYTQGVTIEGAYAYLADGSAGLVVVNIADPANPVIAGAYDTPGYAWGVGVADEIVYVADANGGLAILRFVGE